MNNQPLSDERAMRIAEMCLHYSLAELEAMKVKLRRRISDAEERLRMIHMAEVMKQVLNPSKHSI